MPSDKRTSLIDKLIFGSIVLFLLTLTNSIFFNQLGYYSALILFGIRFYITKENPFKRTGLEYFFIAFVFAEVLSTIFSLNTGQSFNNLLKRVLLIPIVYVIAAGSSDLKKIKLIFNIFMGAALIGMFIYLYFSYKHYISNLFQLQQSGPSLFQYPITASEIMSFVVVFLFAFLINEKQVFKKKVIIFILLFIASLALFSTYKRTGWMGAGAGIITVLILMRKWKLIIPLLAIVILLFILQKNESKVFVYNLSNNSIKLSKQFPTEGRASDILPGSSDFLIADFNVGIINNHTRTPLKSFSAPVTSIKEINDSLITAYLLDTRFVILKRRENNLNEITSFASPGLTASYSVFDNKIYVADEDSGLTVFDAAAEGKVLYRNSELKINQCFADSDYVVCLNKSKEISILKQHNGIPFPANLIKSKQWDIKSRDIFEVFYHDKKIYISGDYGLKIFQISNDTISLISSQKELKNLLRYYVDRNRMIALDASDNLLISNIDELKFRKIGVLSFIPYGMKLSGDKIYFTYYKISRLSSIFDIYNPSNYGRFALWRAGIKIFRDHPIFGVGDIDLASLYKQYKQPGDKEIQGHMHNNFVHILVILGGFGFIIVIAILFKILAVHINIYSEVKNIPFLSSIALGSVASFIAFLVSGLTEWNFGDHEIITMVWFILGLNIAVKYIHSSN